MAFTMTVAELIDADTSGMLGKHATWERVPLAEVATILNGAPFDSALFSTTEGMPLIRIRDVVTGETNTYYAGTYEDAYLVQQGDLLVGMDGDFNSGFWGSKTALLNQRVCKISPVESLYDKQLLSLALPGYLAAINANTPSVTVKHLSSKTIGEIGLPLPPRAEQTRIVAKLEELLTDLDVGVAELKAAQKKLKQYRQSLLKSAVEGALTAEWRAQHTPAETGAQLLQRILTERRASWEAKQLAKFKEQGNAPPKDWQKKYPEPVQPDTTDLPKLPEGWVWASGEQLCVFITKGTTPPKNLDIFGEKTVPFLRVTNLTDRGELDLADEVFVSVETHQGFLARSAVYPDDVLMNIVGPPLGQVSVVPSDFPEWNINQAIAIFRAVEGVLPWFICRYLLSPSAQRWLKARSKTTAGQTNLTLEVCRSLPFPLPPQDEQKALLHTLEAALSSIVSEGGSIAYGLKQSTAQRQNILRAAFAGQLVPQDPNDEPASVLLERIRVERAERKNQPKVRKTKQQKEVAAVVSKLIDVLAGAGDWVPAQEAFRRCGVADGALTDQIEALYAELRALDKAGRLAVEAVTDAQGRKLHDRLKLLVS
ncbi:restriction endonuclease subunit S [Pseudomonas paeninsulae]|uniref:restriction endonuclease subunit S n=1 Tax=Pseudomonas paeninsulae TaxID=3110772 RepID=UPI002D7882EC|nr:restriction endonuclease subunit S [Pseudomonas sp. IT1137]